MSNIVPNSTLELRQLNNAIAVEIRWKRDNNDRAHRRAMRKVEREVVGAGTDAIGLGKGRVRIGRHVVDLTAPARRDARYVSSTGASFFYMAYSSVAKTQSPTTRADGTRAYPNAAAIHVRYVEDGSSVVEAHIPYIDSSRVDLDQHGVRMVRSNISDDYDERVEFFRLVELHERKNHGDKILIDPSRHKEQWAKIAADVRCDEGLRKAMQAIPPLDEDGNMKVELVGSCRKLGVLLKENGLTITKRVWDPSKSKYRQAKKDERVGADGFALVPGRGGRTQYRLVLEVPHEYSSVQRAELLDGLAKMMEDYECMYVAVVHAPDAHNDGRNWHIHLDFYDRPCRRLTGDDWEWDSANMSEANRKNIAPEYAAGDFKQCRGQWDFTVARVSELRKTKRPHYPFRCDKVEVTRPRDFPETVRRRFAEQVNAISAKGGRADRYDPRSYEKAGIAAPKAEKLHAPASRLEGRGVPTKVGIDNERAQASFERRAHDDLWDLMMEEHRDLAADIASRCRPADWGRADELLQQAHLRITIQHNLRLLELEQARERSRAQEVLKTQSKLLGEGSEKQQALAKRLVALAREHLAELDAADRRLLERVERARPLLADLATFDDVQNEARVSASRSPVEPLVGKSHPSSQTTSATPPQPATAVSGSSMKESEPAERAPGHRSSVPGIASPQSVPSSKAGIPHGPSTAAHENKAKPVKLDDLSVKELRLAFLEARGAEQVKVAAAIRRREFMVTWMDEKNDAAWVEEQRRFNHLQRIVDIGKGFPGR